MARVAVEEIIKIIESGWQGIEPVEFKSIKLAPTLVIRGSSLGTKTIAAKEVSLVKESLKES
jgi:hypothetical protein